MRVWRADANNAAASAAAALAPMTVSGMSLGPVKAPAANTPGTEVLTGVKHPVLQKPCLSRAIPSLPASSLEAALWVIPTERTTRS